MLKENSLTAERPGIKVLIIVQHGKAGIKVSIFELTYS